jgi:hypothetical protein
MLAPRDGMGMHLPPGQAAHLPDMRPNDPEELTTPATQGETP